MTKKDEDEIKLKPIEELYEMSNYNGSIEINMNLLGNEEENSSTKKNNFNEKLEKSYENIFQSTISLDSKLNEIGKSSSNVNIKN
jgi:capsular polysaccharide biosynthesis protein